MSGGGDEELERANVAALEPVYEQWSRGNWRPRFDVYADDFEWGWSEEFPELREAVRLEVFSNREKALRAAGLEPA